MATLSVCHRCGVHIFEPMPRCPNCGIDVSSPTPMTHLLGPPVRTSRTAGGYGTPETGGRQSAVTPGVDRADIAGDRATETEISPGNLTEEADSLQRTAEELHDAAAWLRQVEDSLKLGHQSLSTLREALERQLSRLAPLSTQAQAELRNLAAEKEAMETGLAELENARNKLKQREDELRRRTADVFKRENAAEKGDREIASRREDLGAAQAELVGNIAKAAQTERQLRADVERLEKEKRGAEERLDANVKELEERLRAAEAKSTTTEIPATPHPTPEEKKRAAAEKAALEKRKVDLDEREKKLQLWEERVKKARETLKTEKPKK